MYDDISVQDIDKTKEVSEFLLCKKYILSKRVEIFPSLMIWVFLKQSGRLSGFKYLVLDNRMDVMRML